MGKVLEGMGWCLIIAAIGVAVGAQSIVNVRLPLIVVLPWMLTAVVSAIFIIAFGVAIQHLAAIRAASERQADYLRQIAGKGS